MAGNNFPIWIGEIFPFALTLRLRSGLKALSKPVMSLSDEVGGKFRTYRVKPVMLRQGSPEFIEGPSTNGLTTENSDFGKLFLTKS